MSDKDFREYKLISKRYRIIKKIASGGMADIFLGDDLKLNRKVAVKILSANYAGDRNFVARFKSEAQILARLNHPNIVQVYDWGEFNSSYFICMEYVEGESLKEIIEKKGPLPPETVADYAIQISSALLTAHKNNLVHRDIKPQNILVTPEGKVKVTDFGIAKSLITDVTKTLNIMGTAHYISPEQAKGEVLDHRTDIYSLGIVLYEMLTADVPFRGGNSIDISLKHIYEKPLKPSELMENIPDKLEKIIMHCLEKTPLARYPTLRELIGDLQKYETDKPLSFSAKGQNLNRTGVFMKKIRPHLATIIMAAFMVVFLVLFIFYSYKYYNDKTAGHAMVSVPPVENIPAENAKEILALFNLNLIVKDEIYNSEIPEGFIIEQTPEPKKNIPAGSDIEVIISKGQEITFIPIPNLIGLSLEDASEILENSGLIKGNISKEYSSTFKENLIIDQKPKFNERIEPGGSVNIIVSKGEETIIIPNIIGLDFIEASNYLEPLGLIVKSINKAPVTSTDITNETGKIIKVIPSPGSKVKVNSLVEITISTNEPLVLVPNLIQLDLEQAESNLNLIGINYERSYIHTGYSVQEGTVLGQYPEAGTYISPGSSVILFIGS
ncbi:MAG: PASTA domain-containing protein [Actinobacteria bacterium]|nr:PASTA domain-containing protein [Actinomycetota bacterium]MBL7123874.1 PASTA domain-containing protein [Actinomycetota bacterium]